MRLLDRVTCDANHKRFIERIIQSETIWYLSHPDGVATSVSNDDESTTILLFWSDRAYAKNAKRNEFSEYKETSMDLFDFLFRWLPGMSGDKVLSGTNWTYDLIGIESDPFDLREQIEDKMPEEIKRKYEEIYNEATK